MAVKSDRVKPEFRRLMSAWAGGDAVKERVVWARLVDDEPLSQVAASIGQHRMTVWRWVESFKAFMQRAIGGGDVRTLLDMRFAGL